MMYSIAMADQVGTGEVSTGWCLSRKVEATLKLTKPWPV
jgi:hypothetical protein